MTESAQERKPRMKRWLVLLLLLLPEMSCTHADYIQSAYIAPAGSCGYVVMLHDPIGGDRNPQLSKCLPLNEATVLAAQINKDMSGKWSGDRTQ
jgi:hypothetical protein